MVKTFSTVSRVGALGLCFAIGFFWVSYKYGESSFPNLFIKAPIGSFFSFFRVAYEKIKIEANKNVEVRMNLDFIH